VNARYPQVSVPFASCDDTCHRGVLDARASFELSERVFGGILKSNVRSTLGSSAPSSQPAAAPSKQPKSPHLSGGHSFGAHAALLARISELETENMTLRNTLEADAAILELRSQLRKLRWKTRSSDATEQAEAMSIDYGERFEEFEREFSNLATCTWRAASFTRRCRRVRSPGASRTSSLSWSGPRATGCTWPTKRARSSSRSPRRGFRPRV